MAAKNLGKHLQNLHPDLLTLEWRLEARHSKVFFDYLLNARGKSMVAPYSLRGGKDVWLSQPLEWAQLQTIYPENYSIHHWLAQGSESIAEVAEIGAIETSAQIAVALGPVLERQTMMQPAYTSENYTDPWLHILDSAQELPQELLQ